MEPKSNGRMVELARGNIAEIQALKEDLAVIGLDSRVVLEDYLGRGTPGVAELWLKSADLSLARKFQQQRAEFDSKPHSTGAPVAEPSPPMDGAKPIAAGDRNVEEFLVATDTGGGD